MVESRILEIISNLVYQFLKFCKSKTNITFGYARTKKSRGRLLGDEFV